MTINATKGVEIGDGFGAAMLSGEENADEMRMGNDGQVAFLSNHAGGILGGISTGQSIVARVAIKPTSSILTPRRTVDIHGHDTEIVTKAATTLVSASAACRSPKPWWRWCWRITPCDIAAVRVMALPGSHHRSR